MDYQDILYEERGGAVETPIGFLPTPADIDTNGLDIEQATMEALLSVNVEQWKAEMESVGKYLDSYGDRLPDALRREHAQVVNNLAGAD